MPRKSKAQPAAEQEQANVQPQEPAKEVCLPCKGDGLIGDPSSPKAKVCQECGGKGTK